LGAIEAHGPHLPLGADLIIAEAMARAGAERLSQRDWEVLLLPAMPFAPAPFAEGFAGTIDAIPAGTAAIIDAVAGSGARHGVSLTVIANAHHDPAHVAAIRTAVETTRHPVVFPDLTRRRWAARLTDEFQSGACHAGRYESSILLAAAPHLVDVAQMRQLPANPRSLVDAIQGGGRTFVDAGGPEAYFGWPAAATADEGRVIIDALGAIVEEAVVEYVQNKERRTKNKERNDERRNVERNEERRNVERNEERQNEERQNKEQGEERRNEERLRGARMNDGRAEDKLRVVNPAELVSPRGFSHGIAVPAGRTLLHVAGQTAADRQGSVSGTFVEQFERALANVLAVVRASGGDAADVARMTVYVTSVDEYRASRPALAGVWRRHMGSHFPAMALVQVAALVDSGAVVEIEADAHVGARGQS
jgi:creatinine amidohydrolase